MHQPSRIIEPSNRARLLSAGLAELMNCLAILAWPGRFGELSARDRSSLIKTVRTLRDTFGDGTAVEMEADLSQMLRSLPEIERALVAEENIQQLARRFFSAMAVDLDKLTATNGTR